MLERTEEAVTPTKINQEDPRPGEWFNTETTSHLQRRIGYTSLHSAVLAFFAVFIVLNALLHERSEKWLLPILLVGFFSKDLWIFVSKKDRPAKEHINRVRETAGSFSVPVEIDIVQGGILTGSDIGHIGVQDNSLCYSGEQTSFVLGGQQVETRRAVRRGNTLWHMATPALTVNLKHERPAVELRIAPLPGTDRFSRKWQAIERWERLRPDSENLQQFIPLTVNPNLRYDALKIALFHSSIGFIFVLFLIPILSAKVLYLLPLVLIFDYIFVIDYRHFRAVMDELESETRGLDPKT